MTLSFQLLSHRLAVDLAVLGRDRAGDTGRFFSSPSASLQDVNCLRLGQVGALDNCRGLGFK